MKKLPHDPRFDHVDYHYTNLEITFRRIRKQQAEAQEARDEAARKVTPITQQRKGKQ